MSSDQPTLFESITGQKEPAAPADKVVPSLPPKKMVGRAQCPHCGQMVDIEQREGTDYMTFSMHGSVVSPRYCQRSGFKVQGKEVL